MDPTPTVDSSTSSSSPSTAAFLGFLVAALVVRGAVEEPGAEADPEARAFEAVKPGGAEASQTAS